MTSILDEHAALEARLGDPALQGNLSEYTEVTRRFSELAPLAALAREARAQEARVADAHSMLDDPDLGTLAAQELDEASRRLGELEDEFTRLTLPRDAADDRNVIVEIRSGTGGDEAALFAADLFRMYSRRAEALGYRIEVLEASETELGGFSRLSFQVIGKGAYSQFKFESGVHRVQRVPATEAAGRIHTSTATVAVLPEAQDLDVDLNLADVRIDVYRSSGPGGQSVNTTDSAVRVTYRPGTPEELIVTCQEGKSQIKNREKALLVLRSRLFERKRAEEQERQRATRLSQIGTGERSEKIRTYNFPQNRLTDHRLEGENKNYPLAQVMAGDLGPVTDALADLERQELLNAPLAEAR
ncbi:MAG TPA: peptide chain release factor 1 [Deinococcales bacterium]|nr:peptide chain release factor 1 [Deinococcales bacterium]